MKSPAFAGLFLSSVGAVEEASAAIRPWRAVVVVIRWLQRHRQRDRGDELLVQCIWMQRILRIGQVVIAELQRAQDQVMLVVRTAQERVVGFLLEMSKRSRDGDQIILPMSRQDIADYLGLTIETVSRALTQLKDAKMIALPTSRHIVLRDRGALRRLNS